MEISAYNYLQTVKDDICNHCGMNEWKTFEKYLKEYYRSNAAVVEYEPGSISLYRSRVYLENDRYEVWRNPRNGAFKGYNAEQSFVNLISAQNGRCNAKDVPYLYVSLTPEGANAEIRPCAQTLINTAKIQIIEPLRICNFDVNGVASSDPDNGEFLCALFMYLISEFSAPVYDREQGDYRFTQFVCEYLRSNGFDGVKYTSSMCDYFSSDGEPKNRYTNLVIFDYHKCKAVSSDLVLVKKVCVETEPQKIV